MAVLTTSPQVIGEHGGTQHTRLYAWYSDQSGNSCIVHFRLTVVYEGVTYTGTNKLRCLAYDGYNSGTIAYGDAPLNANQEYTVMEGSRWYDGGSTVNASALYWSYVYGSSDIGNSQATVPSFYTPPTGLGIDNLVRGIEEFTARVYLSGWGQNSGGSKYRELQVWTQGMSEPRRYQPQWGNDLSGTITCNNSSSGSLTIRGNTMYTLGAYASNGNVSTGSQNKGNYTTLAYASTNHSVDNIEMTSARLNWTIPADGGKYDKNYYYSLDNGSTWILAKTYSGGSAGTGSCDISGLSPCSQYTIKFKVVTSAGTTNCPDFTFKTSGGLYGSVNGQTKKVTKLYGSVSGQTKEIKKLYASVGGVTKRIF